VKRLLPLLILSVIGCESTDYQVFEPQPNIFALMQVPQEASTVYQFVKVDRSYDIEDTISSFGVTGAQVLIRNSKDTFLLVDSFFDNDSDKWVKQPDGWYGGEISVNDTSLYTLKVTMPSGDTVTGQAYMPSPLRILNPFDSTVVSISEQVVNPLTITWNFCKNTQYYLVMCIPDVDTSELDNYPPFLLFPSIRADTAYTLFLERTIFPWVYDMYYVLRVVAVSSEYSAYMGFQGPGGDMSNLSMGYGMFGGISQDSVRVYIVE